MLLVDVIARLEDIFTHIYAKPEEDSYFKDLISGNGELRIDDICQVCI